MVKAVGTYTGTERQMLLCVCARPQVYRIRMAAYRIDPRLHGHGDGNRRGLR